MKKRPKDAKTVADRKNQARERLMSFDVFSKKIAKDSVPVGEEAPVSSKINFQETDYIAKRKAKKAVARAPSLVIITLENKDLSTKDASSIENGFKGMTVNGQKDKDLFSEDSSPEEDGNADEGETEKKTSDGLALSPPRKDVLAEFKTASPKESFPEQGSPTAGRKPSGFPFSFFPIILCNNQK